MASNGAIHCQPSNIQGCLVTFSPSYITRLLLSVGSARSLAPFHVVPCHWRLFALSINELGAPPRNRRETAEVWCKRKKRGGLFRLAIGFDEALRRSHRSARQPPFLASWIGSHGHVSSCMSQKLQQLSSNLFESNSILANSIARAVEPQTFCRDSQYDRHAARREGKVQGNSMAQARQGLHFARTRGWHP